MQLWFVIATLKVSTQLSQGAEVSDSSTSRIGDLNAQKSPQQGTGGKGLVCFFGVHEKKSFMDRITFFPQRSSQSLTTDLSRCALEQGLQKAYGNRRCDEARLQVVLPSGLDEWTVFSVFFLGDFWVDEILCTFCMRWPWCGSGAAFDFEDWRCQSGRAAVAGTRRGATACVKWRVKWKLETLLRDAKSMGRNNRFTIR